VQKERKDVPSLKRKMNKGSCLTFTPSPFVSALICITFLFPAWPRKKLGRYPSHQTRRKEPTGLMNPLIPVNRLRRACLALLRCMCAFPFFLASSAGSGSVIISGLGLTTPLLSKSAGSLSMGTSATGDSISGLEVTTPLPGDSPPSKSNSDPGRGEGG